MLKIYQSGLKDDRFGQRLPLISQPRGVHHFEDVKFPRPGQLQGDIVLPAVIPDLTEHLEQYQKRASALCAQQYENPNLKDKFTYWFAARSLGATGSTKKRPKILSTYVRDKLRRIAAKAVKVAGSGQHLTTQRKLGTLGVDGTRPENEDAAKEQLTLEQMRLEEHTKRTHQALQNQIELEDFPERFTHYPDRPTCRFIPTPKLMHQMIFQCVQLYIGKE